MARGLLPMEAPLKGKNPYKAGYATANLVLTTRPRKKGVGFYNKVFPLD
jgi:hypothetical protein